MRRQKHAPHYAAGEAGAAIAGGLLNWFALHQRDLPWRRSRDPYRIWVCEVMLQQTRVETVIPYYHRWMAQFPTLHSLAAAPEEAVLKAWEGLGYYSRARNLHKAVQEVAAHYGGDVPDDPGAVRALQGVGPYTAGAILSIAFNRPEPAVDGNVMRVLSRLFRIADDITRPATQAGMGELARELIPTGQANAFNQALMELGALVCTPARPGCLVCPVAERCQARLAGVAEQLPVKARAKAPRPVDVIAGVIWHRDRVLVVKRPAKGLLGGLWEFPGGPLPAGLDWEQGLHDLVGAAFGLEVEVESPLVRVSHVFTHLVWDLRAYSAFPAPGAAIPAEGPTLRWVRPDELQHLAFPVAHQKVIAAVLACPAGAGEVKSALCRLCEPGG